ncbi:hypothetical protein E6P75_08570 [Moraxella osloensis]|uniref:CopG family transcriptional regulator n=1 Tax=Faucicola osloensis TaxID=34062 RepID=A0AAW6TC87_FAUOS|nr:hypothetical protein [Moraxella osloensis]MDI4510259.1 hypothetical protein [Moraxella osloensis]
MMQDEYEKISLRVPKQLKAWANDIADENCQTLSGYIMKLLLEERKRLEQKRLEQQRAQQLRTFATFEEQNHCLRS